MENQIKAVVCIDASDIPKQVKQLVEGKKYFVRGIEKYGKGYGYLLKGIDNSHIGVRNHPNLEPGYGVWRFIPCSEVEQTVIELQTELL